MDPYKPEEICEALTRHTELTGSEIFEKNYIRDEAVSVTIWCVVGPNAAAFRAMALKWLKDNNFIQD